MSSSRRASGIPRFSNLYSGGTGGAGGSSNTNLSSQTNEGVNNTLNTRSMQDYGSTGSTKSSSAITSDGDPVTEFISLSENIGQNIKSFISCSQTLDKAVRVIGTQKDNQTFRNKIHQIQTITNTKIITTRKDIQRLTIVVRGCDKQQSLIAKKLSSDFNDYVERYNKAEQKIAAKMRTTVLTSSQDVMGQGIMDDEEASMNNDDKENIIQQEQKRLNRDLKFEHSILQENEKRVKQIETDVLNINEIMRELNMIINSQGDMINTLEGNVEKTVDIVEDAASVLLKATRSRAKHRKTVVIIFIVAVVVGIIIAGIIVAKLKK